ncbi:hypothetical protein BN1200_420077 [Klebsiella variicola]|nr:hypothetical protein BN1200_420077 [Klebsiella variicola]
MNVVAARASLTNLDNNNKRYNNDSTTCLGCRGLRSAWKTPLYPTVLVFLHHAVRWL